MGIITHRVRNMLAILVILAMTPDLIRSAPRPSSDFLSALRSSSGGKLAMGKDWGLNPAAISEFRNNNLDTKALRQILSRSNSPSVRFLLKDHLFLRHLQLFLDQPNENHFHQLKNRAKTLRRRRTDEVSTRFFLRD
eukprot:TRINITY_DN60294_c0_g1_i1.p1 TRINITY_DN60294_c0_g1~~TRINITY_DN60294_c0_g1_i1.p1  ORF type:complete len:137 (-),score=32.50 TRINITY_DN60294_c0_g1_i1:145-555(-)